VLINISRQRAILDYSFPSSLYSSEIRYLTLRGEHTLKISEEQLLKEMSESNEEGPRSEWSRVSYFRLDMQLR
jgi:hypothetical protein